MKNKKLENLKLRTRTKVYIPVTAVLIVAILLSSAIPIADIKLGTDGSSVNWFGAIGVITNSNGKYWEATGANVLASVWDLNSTGGTVNLPGGTTITINRGFKIPENTTIYFNGCRLLLDDLGVEKTYMINMYNDNVTLVDPWLDMDRANNEVNPASGNQIAIYFNGNSHNCEIIGGIVENACQSGIGGASHGLTISSTKIIDPGEHGMYFSANSSNMLFENVDVIEPGINGTRRGYGFKFDNIKSCSVENCYVEYTGYESFPGDSSIGVVIGGGSRDIKVDCRVVNASYGIYAGSSTFNGRPCENIDISLVCEGCGQFANDATPGNIIGTYVHDSFMDLGVFRPDAFGDNAVIERLLMNNTGSSNLTTLCYLSAASHNVSFTLKDSVIRGTGSYIVSITTGHDLIIENNVIINDNASANNYCCLRLSDVSGNIRVDDNIFKGGSHWSLRYDSDNENFLCSSNRFREPYNGDTPGTAIEWIKEPNYKNIRGNINETDNTTSINISGRLINATYDEILTLIRNSNGNYWDATGANIQLALNDVGNDSGWVRLGTADYTITSHLSIWNNTKFHLDGATIILDAAANDEMINLGYKTPGLHNGVHNILIEGGTLDGNNDSQTFSEYVTGMMICSDSSNITIRDMTIKNTCGCGIRMLRQVGETIPMTNITIDNCIFGKIQKEIGEYWGGVQLSGKYCTVKNSRFIDNYACGIILQEPNFDGANFNLVEGNVIMGEVSVGIWMESGQASNNTIRGNIIRDINSSAYVGVGFYSRGMTIGKDNIIENNHIINVVEYGFYLGDNEGYNTFTGNTVDGVTGGMASPTGYAVFFGGNNIHKNKFVRNTFKNFIGYGCLSKNDNEFTDNYFEGGTRGLSVSTGNNVTINYNEFIGQSGDGIMLFNCTDCTVIGNYLNTNSDGIQSTGTGSNYNIITNNNMRHSTTPENIDITTANGNSSIANNIPEVT